MPDEYHPTLMPGHAEPTMAHPPDSELEFDGAR
jgi:hypothetical protein